jgi:glycerol-3-phosphate dehydrogenase
MMRSAELRPPVIQALGVPHAQTGALVRPGGTERRDDAIERLETRARANGVLVVPQGDGSLLVPGESITDPVAYTIALAGATGRLGTATMNDHRVEEIARAGKELVLSIAGDAPPVRTEVAVNCAGLSGDEVARGAGDDRFRIVPRKGEFFVFDPPPAVKLEHILLPVPSGKTKGVLVFPTVDGMIIAGPTARDQTDKHDWSVRPEAAGEVMAGAITLLPELEGLEPVASYAGLRPAGADGVNYLIEWSGACPGLLHVGAIRSTGLSSSLAIGEHVAEMIDAAGYELGPPQPLEPGDLPRPAETWWRRAARRSQASRRAS